MNSKKEEKKARIAAEKAEREQNKRKKKARSFVWPLTLRQVSGTLRAFLVVDLFLVALYLCMTVVGAEKQVAGLYGLPPAEMLTQTSALMPEIRIEEEHSYAYGVALPVSMEEELGTPAGTLRQLRWDSVSRFFLHDEGGELWYTVYIPSPEADIPTERFYYFYDETADASTGRHADRFPYVRVTVDLSMQIYRLRALMMVLLCVEGVLLFLSLLTTRHSVSKILAPIRQLTEAARSISAEPPEARKKRQQDAEQAQQELELSGTIHTLNTITARKLDTRIPIEDERDELKGLASAINNMLDRLDAAYQSQLRFVSDASHELRTPIAVIQGYANLLDRWGKDDPAALQESIEAIRAETAGMQALVEQLLFLARSDNNSIVAEMQRLDLSALADEVMRDSRIIDGCHVFVSDVEPGLHVMGDVGLLKQALRIFMDNAIKYTPPGEQIRISVKGDAEWSRVSVSDNGIGIPEEDLPHVFERFFRSDESRARKTGGTGLGLAIARWTVQRHGGFVEILSRVDIGTRITMVLPRAGAAEPAPPPEPTIRLEL